MIAISGNYACLAGVAGAAALIDISDPANPKSAGAFEGFGEYGVGAVGISGDYAYVTAKLSGLHVVQLRPANPQRLASLQFGTVNGDHGPGGLASSVAVAGNYAIVADMDSGVHVVDIHDPGNPRRVGDYGSRSDVYGIAVSDNHAYVGGTLWDGSNEVDNGLQVLDISDPTNPQRVGGVSFAGDLSGPVIEGHYAYLTGFKYGANNGLWIFDLSNPIAPRHAASYLPRNSASYLCRAVVSGQYAYIAMLGSYAGTNYIGGGGLEVVDVSDPTKPHRAGAYDAGGHVRGVALAGHYAVVTVEDPYGTGTNGGLAVIDIADPANPRRVGACSGASSGDSGVRQFRLRGESGPRSHRYKRSGEASARGQELGRRWTERLPSNRRYGGALVRCCCGTRPGHSRCVPPVSPGPLGQPSARHVPPPAGWCARCGDPH